MTSRKSSSGKSSSGRRSSRGVPQSRGATDAPSAGRSGKWFTLLIIGATGIVASLPFQGGQSPSPAHRSTPHEDSISLRISQQESAGASSNSGPRPVMTPRIHSATLKSPDSSFGDSSFSASHFKDSEAATTGGENASAVVTQRPPHPVEQPSWDASRYAANATGISEPDESVSVTAQGPGTESDSASRGDTTEERGELDSAAATAVTSQGSEEHLPATTPGEASRYSTTDTSMSAGGDADVLPSPNQSRYGSPFDSHQETTASDSESDVAAKDENSDALPPPRPRLTVTEAELPAPRGDRQASDGASERLSADDSVTVADDGFRAVGRREPDAVQGAEVSQTIQQPTRVVRLAPPPERGPKPIQPPLHHVVRDGDTLQSIAEQYWGESKYWRALFTTNRALLSDPDLLPIGARLKLPNDDFFQTLRATRR